MSMMAQGCCSASSPCSHQKRDPTTLCKTCQEANALRARHTPEENAAAGEISDEDYKAGKPGTPRGPDADYRELAATGRRPPLTPTEIARAVGAEKKNPMFDVNSPPMQEAASRARMRLDPPPRRTMDFPKAMDYMLNGQRRIGRQAWPTGSFIAVIRVPFFHAQYVEAPSMIDARNHVFGVQLGRQVLRYSPDWNAWAPWTPTNEEIFERDWFAYD